MIVFLWIMGLLGSASLSAWLAAVKGRSIGSWLVLGLLFGPLALLALVGAPQKGVKP